MIVITVARKPLVDSYARHVPCWGTGAINIDGCRILTEGDMSTSRRWGNQNTATTYNDHGWKRVGEMSLGSPLGRFPSNLILGPEATEALGLVKDGDGDVTRYFKKL